MFAVCSGNIVQWVTIYYDGGETPPHSKNFINGYNIMFLGLLADKKNYRFSFRFFSKKNHFVFEKTDHF